MHYLISPIAQRLVPYAFFELFNSLIHLAQLPKVGSQSQKTAKTYKTNKRNYMIICIL